MEKMEEAKEDFQKAVDLNPDFALAYVQKCYTDYRYAIVKRDVLLVESCLKNFEKAFEKFPDCPDCYTLYAEVYYIFYAHHILYGLVFYKLLYNIVRYRYCQKRWIIRKQIGILLKQSKRIRIMPLYMCIEDYCSYNGIIRLIKLLNT